MLFQKWWFLRSILKYGSPLISLSERRELKGPGNQSPDHPVVFVIGPPRSGSTIVYQLITSLLPVAYIDNLANLARANPCTGMRLSRRIFGDASHSSFTSRYGRTEEGGLHAPAEALFFYKWFPRERHYTECSDLSREQMDDFRKTLCCLVNGAGKPLVIKNLSFSMRLQVLREVVPEARYIVVRRDPLFTSQSLIQARRNNNVPENQVWGILPKNVENLIGLNPYEMVVRQIHLIEKQIYEDLKNYPEDRIVYINYEELSEHIDAIMEKVKRLIGINIENKHFTEVPTIKTHNELSLNQDEIVALQKNIQKFDWEFFTDKL